MNNKWLPIINALIPGLALLIKMKWLKAFCFLLTATVIHFLILRAALSLGIMIIVGTVLTFLVLVLLGFILLKKEQDLSMARNIKNIFILVLFSISSLALYLLPRYTVGSFHAASMNMAPAITSGDYIGVDRIAYLFSKPERNDIVMFQTGNRFIGTISGDNISGKVIKESAYGL